MKERERGSFMNVNDGLLLFHKTLRDSVSYCYQISMHIQLYIQVYSVYLWANQRHVSYELGYSVLPGWWRLMKIKVISKWKTFHNWWFWTSEINWLFDLLGMRVDREIRLCLYLSYDKPFIYSLAQNSGDPVSSHMYNYELPAGKNQDLVFI